MLKIKTYLITFVCDVCKEMNTKLEHKYFSQPFLKGDTDISNHL